MKPFTSWLDKEEYLLV